MNFSYIIQTITHIRETDNPLILISGGKGKNDIQYKKYSDEEKANYIIFNC
ncbi:MAG: hypothetical protein ACI86H_001405 [bacterium]|jgi:hypothetical protein